MKNMDGEIRLVKCRNPLCMRKIHETVAYCCFGCRRAHDKNYEIHEEGILGHSTFCNERTKVRGECTREEAMLLNQDRAY